MGVEDAAESLLSIQFSWQLLDWQFQVAKPPRQRRPEVDLSPTL